MYKKYLIQPVLAVFLALGFSAAAFASSGGPVADITHSAGGYSINLKLLPAEPFVKQSEAKKAANKGAMVFGGGDNKPVAVGSDANPNQHLVVFIKKDGKPVQNATVQMTYKKVGSKAKATVLPVTPMWVAGIGKATMHYGNNLHLSPGKYVVHVTVNGKAKTKFKVTEKPA